MNEYLQLLGFNVETIKKKTEHTAFSKFSIPNNTIIYFDLIGDFYLNIEYEKNYIHLKDEFKKANLDLFFLPKIDFPNLDLTTIEYFIPHLKNHINLSAAVFSHTLIDNEKDDSNYFSLFKFDYQALLDYLGYKGNIKSGIIIICESNIYIVEHTNIDFLNGIKDPKDIIIEYFLGKMPEMVFYSRENDFNFSPREFQNKLEENLDEETKLKILQINEQIEEFKNSGSLMYILPLLKKTLQKYENEIDLDSISKIYVDSEYNITLPYFNNMIIPLSHLTKAIYIFFTKHPDGIDVKNLYHYKDELKNIYFSVSYQENLDKMNQSISDLIAPNSNAIYSHISRIKSTFYKLMDKFYADNYIITGGGYGNSLKYIPVLKPVEINKNNGFSDEDIVNQTF